MTPLRGEAIPPVYIKHAPTCEPSASRRFTFLSLLSSSIRVDAGAPSPELAREGAPMVPSTGSAILLLADMVC